MSKNNKSKLEIISRKITLIELVKDKDGKYISYCNFFRHRGVIGHMKAKACKRLDCNHYKKFRDEYNKK